MPADSLPLCPECSAPLEADDVCLSCVFGEALSSQSNPGPAAGSGFGNFAPSEAGTFGKYTLRQKLGAGGMGVIWEAEESGLRRVVALKMIRGFAFSSEADRQRFQAEATAVAQLDHPHIVPIHEVGEVDEQPFFTMKLFEGGSLSDRLKSGPLPPRTAARMMKKLARAVDHAHRRGVLHRDLKPGNILFDRAGEPHLTDFGLAKLLDAEPGLTLTRDHVGTPQYMSPEQARGRPGDITTASDVWALGAIFYQMLTGRLPFPGESVTVFLHSIVHDEPAPMAAPTAPVDAELRTLCLRCMEKDPARRLASAAELAAELGRWLKGVPIHSRPIGGGERALRWIRRHPWRVAAFCAIAVSLLAGSIVSLALWRRAEENRRIAETTGERSLALAAAERSSNYVSTINAALAARERHDFARARQLLAAAPEEHRGFGWRLLQGFCKGDQQSLFRLPGGEIPEALGMGPDGKSLAIISGDGVLHLFDPDGRELRASRKLPAPAAEIDLSRQNPLNFHSLAYSPDGRHFTCAFRNSIRIFDAETLEVLMEKSDIVGVQSGWLDDQRLLFGWDNSKSVGPYAGAWIFDIGSRRTVALPPGWNAPLAVSPDRGTVALSSGRKFDVTLFHTADLAGAEPLKMAAPVAVWRPYSDGSSNILALSDGGKYLASLCGALDAPAHNLEVAEMATGKTLVLQYFREAMTGVVFHPTEPLVALCSSDAVVRMFHFLQPPPPGPPTFDDDGPPVTREPIDGNGAHSPPHRLLTRSALDGRAVFLLGHERGGTGIRFSPDGGNLFTSSFDGTVRRWGTGIPKPPIRIADAHLERLEFHPSASADGNRVIYTTRRHWVRYWRHDVGSVDVAENQMPLAVLPEGRMATMDSATSDILLWQENGAGVRETGRIRGPGFIQGFRGLLRGVVTLDGKRIVGMTPGRIFVVDLAAGTVSATDDEVWQTGPARVWDLAVSPDGRHIAATGLGHRTRIYDIEDLGKPPVWIGDFRNYDTALAFHPDGSRLCCGNEDGRVRVFETARWTELSSESWQAQSGAVTAIAVGADARRIATAGDTTLKLWKSGNPAIAEPILLLTFSNYRPAAWLRIARDAAGEDRALMLCPPFGPLEIWPGAADGIPK